MDDHTEGVIVAEISLDPSRRVCAHPVVYGSYGGGFIDAGTSGNAVRDIVCYVDAFLCGMSYRLSAERRSKVRAVSSSAHVG
jgi:hypothetical protein